MEATSSSAALRQSVASAPLLRQLRRAAAPPVPPHRGRQNPLGDAGLARARGRRRGFEANHRRQRAVDFGRRDVLDGYSAAMLPSPAYLPCSLGVAEGVVACHVEFRVSNQHPVVAGMLLVTGITECPDHAELFVGMARMAFPSECWRRNGGGWSVSFPRFVVEAPREVRLRLHGIRPENPGFVGAVLFPRLPD